MCITIYRNCYLLWKGKTEFLRNKIIISGAALVQQRRHASRTDLTLLHPLPLPPPSAPPPIVVPSPVGVGRLPEQAFLCVASGLVDLSWSSATKFPNRLARDPAPSTISKSSNLSVHSKHISIPMADPLAQFSMLGGFNSQLVPNPNAAGASQQQQPSDSMQPIGGLPNPEQSRMWMQIQQQMNQQRTASAGDIVGSQVTLNSFFIPSLSLFRFYLPLFLHSPIPHPFVITLRPPLCFFLLQTPPSCQPSRLTRSGLLTSAVAFVTFLLTPPPSLPTASRTLN